MTEVLIYPRSGGVKVSVKPGPAHIANTLIKNGDPLATDLALHQADLGGLPPTLIHCGSGETLLRDAHALTQRLHECGVDVALTVWEGKIHVFHAAWFLPEARHATAEIGTFIRQHTTDPRM